MLTYIVIGLVAAVELATCQMISPCPEVFQYETRSPNDDRWYGNMTLSSRQDLSGVWIKVILDGTAELLGNWFGEAISTDNIEFTIKNPSHHLTANTELKVRFFIKYNTARTIPSLREIRLNGNVVCSRNQGESNTPRPQLHLSQNPSSSSSSSNNHNLNSGNSGISSGGVSRPTGSSSSSSRPSSSGSSRPSGSSSGSSRPPTSNTGSSSRPRPSSSGSSSGSSNNNREPVNNYGTSSSGTSNNRRDVVNEVYDNEENTWSNNNNNLYNNQRDMTSGLPRGPVVRTTTGRYDVIQSNDNSNGNTRRQNAQNTGSAIYDQSISNMNQNSNGPRNNNGRRRGSNTGRDTSFSNTDDGEYDDRMSNRRNNRNSGRNNRNNNGNDDGVQVVRGPIVRTTTTNRYDDFYDNNNGNNDGNNFEDNNYDNTNNNGNDRNIRSRNYTRRNNYGNNMYDNREPFMSATTTVRYDTSYDDNYDTSNNRNPYNNNNNGDAYISNTNNDNVRPNNRRPSGYNNNNGNSGNGDNIVFDTNMSNKENSNNGFDSWSSRDPDNTYSRPTSTNNNNYNENGNSNSGRRKQTSNSRQGDTESSQRNPSYNSEDNYNTNNRPSGGGSSGGINNQRQPTYSNANSYTDDDEDDNSSSSDYFQGDLAVLFPKVDKPSPPSRNPGNHLRVPKCGTVMVRPSALISHAQNTSPGQWPWHVALYHSQGIQLTYICGATLISENHLVTAAHCVTKPRTSKTINPENLLAYLGKYSLRTFGSEVQGGKISAIYVHPNYNSSVYFNDIAILKLGDPADITNHVRPVCLWEEETDIDSVVDRLGTVVGWGFDENKKLSNDLMKTEMPVVTNLKCIYSNREFFSQFTFEKTFCAGFRNGTSVCNGDSGGGMVFPKSGTSGTNTVWQLRGVVSVGVALQGEGVCDPSHYVVFADAAKHRDWIREIMSTS